MMINKLLLTILCTTTFTFTQAQYSEDFETTTLTPLVRGGGTPQASGASAANPVIGGINTSATAFEITLEDTAAAFRWLGVPNTGGIGATYGSTDGTIFKFMYLSVNETSVTIQLEPWFTGVRHQTEIVTKTVAVNTWNEIEFDFSEAVLFSDGSTPVGAEPGALTRLDFKFNVIGTTPYDGDVFYMDNLEQNLTQTLGVNDDLVFNEKKLDVYPNPANGVINISITNDINSVTIHNLLGQTMKTFTRNETMDISDLSKGMYLVVTDSGLTQKILKQ